MLPVELATSIRDAQRTGVHMISAVSAFDVSAVVSGSPGLTVWCQPLDPVGFGSNTGHLAPSTAISRGAVGSLLNHSECRVSFEHIENVISMFS